MPYELQISSCFFFSMIVLDRITFQNTTFLRKNLFCSSLSWTCSSFRSLIICYTKSPTIKTLLSISFLGEEIRTSLYFGRTRLYFFRMSCLCRFSIFTKLWKFVSKRASNVKILAPVKNFSQCSYCVLTERHWFGSAKIICSPLFSNTS